MKQNLKRNWLVLSKLTWGIWRILTRTLENLKNLHFNGLLLNKVYNVWPKKVYGSYVWWHWILIQSLKETWHVLSKMTWGIIASFHQSTFESLKIRSFTGSFYPELKTYRGVLFYDNEEWCYIWRGTDLSVHYWHDAFDKFWPEHSKISNIYTLTGCFWPK